jgi:uncharacterized protein (UPF0332 family)
MAHPLLEVARLLLVSGDTLTAKAARNKAVSTAYYAVFAEVCALIANCFADPEQSGGLGSYVRHQRAFRALDHNTLRKVAQQIADGAKSKASKVAGKKGTASSSREADGLDNASLQVALTDSFTSQRIWATNCVALQEARHSADYDPYFMASLQEAESRIVQAEEALEALSKLGESGRRKLAFDLVFSNQRVSQRP